MLSYGLIAAIFLLVFYCGWKLKLTIRWPSGVLEDRVSLLTAHEKRQLVHEFKDRASKDWRFFLPSAVFCISLALGILVPSELNKMTPIGPLKFFLIAIVVSLPGWWIGKRLIEAEKLRLLCALLKARASPHSPTGDRPHS